MDNDLRHFIRVWLISSTVLVTGTVFVNVFLDPYLVFGTPQIQHFNARKPAIDTDERRIKAYDVLRETPNTLILGSSSADLGLNAQSSAWPASDRPVYNLSLRGGSPYVAYRYLQHLMHRRPPALVVMGLEFESFVLAPDNRELDIDSKAPLQITPEGDLSQNQTWRHARDMVDATLSFHALLDSANTLIANLRGQPNGAIEENLALTEPLRYVSSLPLVAITDFSDSKWYGGKRRDPLVMQDLARIINLCEAHGTQLILFVSPSRVDELEIFDLSGMWEEFENWKRDLVRLTMAHRSGIETRGIPLWDFSGYDVYSAESLPPNGKFLRWFQDSWHYRPELGDMIIQRVFGAEHDGWGTRLTIQNVEMHLESIRQQQHLYRIRQSEDAQQVRVFYQSMAAVRTRIFNNGVSP